MHSASSQEVNDFSPMKVFTNYVIDGFFSIMGAFATLNGVLSLLHIWFGWFDNATMKMGRHGTSVELMDDLPSTIGILVIGIVFILIVWIRKQARWQNWYRSHRLMFWISFLILALLATWGGYKGLIQMNGGNAIYAAQGCDTETIRELHTKGEIADTDKNEMMMRMAQNGCSQALSYVLDQGWDANTMYNDIPVVNTAGSFATAATIMALVDHGADVNSSDQGVSLLMRVLQNSSILPEEKKYVVKTLIEKGANVDYTSTDGLSVDRFANSAGIDLSSL